MPPARKRSRSARHRETRFPLDPAYLVQRPFDEGPAKSLPTLTLKSPTKNPTIYRKRVKEVDPAARHGDLVQVLNPDGQPVGVALWNPRAEATARLLERHERLVNARWWKQKLDDALALRREFHLLNAETEAVRLVNAEGDGLPGLTADRYGETLSVQVFTLAMYQRAEAIAQSLAKFSDCKHWLVRCGPLTYEQEGFLADGFGSLKVPGRVGVQEYGVRYELSPQEGHKTGFFCDQRENRRRLREYCQGKKVLDLCCYSGGFALNAALAGAQEVTAVDLDEDALAVAKRNAQLNKARVRFVHADAFAYLRDMLQNGRRFDVVVLDPPKLIRTKADFADGQSKYFDLNKLASSTVVPGGLLLTCSCSGLFSMEDFTRTVRAATAHQSPQMLARTGAGADHPVALDCLESEYLKCLWLRCRGGNASD